jgi:hypothetical protein
VHLPAKCFQRSFGIASALKGGKSWVPSNPDGSRVFHKPLGLHLARFERQGTQDGPKTDFSLNAITKPENRNHDHFTPISGQASALTGAGSFDSSRMADNHWFHVQSPYYKGNWAV